MEPWPSVYSGKKIQSTETYTNLLNAALRIFFRKTRFGFFPGFKDKGSSWLSSRVLTGLGEYCSILYLCFEPVMLKRISCTSQNWILLVFRTLRTPCSKNGSIPYLNSYSTNRKLRFVILRHGTLCTTYSLSYDMSIHAFINRNHFS